MKTASLPAVALALLGAACSQTAPADGGVRAHTGALSPSAAPSLDKVLVEPAAARGLLRAGPRDRVEVYVSLAGDAAVDTLSPGASPGEPAVVEAVKRRLAAIEREQAPVVASVESAGGEVTARHRRLVNAVQAYVPLAAIPALSRVPGVIAIERVPVYRRANTSAVPFIGGYAAWSELGGFIHGKGVRVGVIDTGIDYTHADFGGPGTPEAYTANDSSVVEPLTFPTAKVVGGRDFVGDKYNAESGASPKPDDDPLDCAGLQQMEISGGHGTHVAGTIAGVGVSSATGKAFTGSYSATLDPRSFRVGPGVAPEASLYALKVFGCTGSTSAVAAALEWASDPNNDGDFTDRLDVLNLSLGGSYGLPTAADVKQIKNLTKLGTFLAIAAGNDGGTFFITGSPGTYSEVLSVAASTDTLTYDTLTVVSPGSVAGDYPASEGSFTKPLAATGNLTGALVATSPTLACSALTNADALKGKIALIDRGACTFVDKIARAEAAGAVAALVIDQEDNEVPFSMGGSGKDVGIPGMLIRLADGAKIRAALADGVIVTFRSDKAFELNIGADQIAGFSSRGPRLNDASMKPEISAPGVSVSSAGVATGNGARELQGTSMACPVIAGAAALVRQAFPSFTPVEVKAALMNNTADIGDGTGKVAPVSLQGAGRVRVDQAIQAKATARVVATDGSVGVSFGVFVVDEDTVAQKTVQITNHSAEAITYDLGVKPTKDLPGADVSVLATSVTVPANETATVELALAVSPGALPIPAVDAFTAAESRSGEARHFLVEVDGHLVLAPRPAPGSAALPALRVPYYGIVRAAGQRRAVASPDCGDTFTLKIEGSTKEKETFTTAFELGGSFEHTGSSNGSILAAGAASDIAENKSLDETTAYFAIAVSNAWTTPAQGPLSLVGVSVDVDNDDAADFITYVEPRRRGGPYSDTLVATTYFANGNRAGQPRAINILTRDEGDTHPFDNDVLVLPVTATSLGLDPGMGKIRYAVFTQSLSSFTPNQTDWIPFDLEHPTVDTSTGIEGKPIFKDAKSILVKLDRARLAGKTPSILVVHHGNVPGKRFDVVSLPLGNAKAELDLKIGDSVLRPSGELALSVTVRNDGPTTSLTLATPVTGGTLVSRTGENIVCGADLSAPCVAAAVGRGQTAKVALVVKPSAAEVTVAATLALPEGCFGKGAGSTLARTFHAEPFAAPAPSGSASGVLGKEPIVGGGFDCAFAAGTSRSGAAGLPVALALLLTGGAARGRRRSAAPRPRSSGGASLQRSRRRPQDDEARGIGVRAPRPASGVGDRARAEQHEHEAVAVHQLREGNTAVGERGW